jgi:hypothetical protein
MTRAKAITAGLLILLLVSVAVWYTQAQHAAGVAECEATHLKQDNADLVAAIEKNTLLQAQVNRLSAELLQARSDPHFTTVTRVIYEKVPAVPQCNYQPDDVSLLNSLVSRADHYQRIRASESAD